MFGNTRLRICGHEIVIRGKIHRYNRVVDMAVGVEEMILIGVTGLKMWYVL
jgi:hypothetical protein